MHNNCLQKESDFDFYLLTPIKFNVHLKLGVAVEARKFIYNTGWF